MSKYSMELKLKIVKEYQSEVSSYKKLAEKYEIKGKYKRNQVGNWVRQFKDFGEEGLKKKEKSEDYTVQFKLNAVELHLTSEMTHREIAIKLGIKNSCLISTWIKKYRENGLDGLSNTKGSTSMKKIRENVMSAKKPKEAKTEVPESVQELLKEQERRIRLLEIENAYLKRSRRLRNTQEEISNECKARIIHSLRGPFQLKEILEVVNFPKSTYMYWKIRFDRANPDQELETVISALCSKHKDYGYRRVTPELKKIGYHVNHKKVLRLMRKLKLSVKMFTRKTRRYSSYKGKVGTVFPNLLKRRFKTNVVHQKATTDTTEFKYTELDDKGKAHIKKAYLNPYLDLYNLEIISFRVTKQPTFEPIKEALEEAIEKTKDCKYRRTFHSDQGWAYQLKAYVKTLKDNKIFQSMSRKGNCIDNSPMENFFGLLKQQIYHGRTYTSYEELESEINTFINYYNNERSKERLGYMSPVEYRQLHNEFSIA
jgi:transposase InsO family protein/transposase-like protein